MQSVILEIRAAEGGEDAKLLVNDQLEIYNKTCTLKGYWLELLEKRPGYVCSRISGKDVTKTFKDEGGGHRWQRISPTEKRGRVHTSTVTVAVLPEVNNITIHIPESDLEITTARGSGKGGQHRNVTDSAVQIKHKPTGMIVRCEDERRQGQNKDRAMAVLKQRLHHREVERTNSNVNQKRKNQVGSGMRGDKIRTIRMQDGRVVNHINNKRTSLRRYLRGFIDDLR